MHDEEMPDAYIERTREFFGTRAATWDTKFGHDLPVYAAAIAEAGIRRGAVAVDAGCGTGRALPALRDVVGPDGTVIALELTPQMLAQARAQGWAKCADLLVLADARALPFASAWSMPYSPPDWSTTCPIRQPDLPARPGHPARRGLALFHPIGRAALAARHGRTISPDEVLSPAPLRAATAATGWELAAYDDAPDRFLALAIRRLPAAGTWPSPTGPRSTPRHPGRAGRQRAGRQRRTDRNHRARRATGGPATPGTLAPPDCGLARPGSLATTKWPSCMAASP